jgi:DNA-directed RNA polymerase specialized sigma subunit
MWDKWAVIEQAKEKLEDELGREPTHEELEQEIERRSE